MIDKLSYFGIVSTDGIMRITNRKKFDADVLKYFPGKDIIVEVIERPKTRSERQNRYYWGVVIPIMIKGFQDLGYDVTKDDVHDFNKKEFNFEEIVNEGTGEIIKMPRSTTVIEIGEFNKTFISKIQQFAAEFLSCYIPDPKEDLTLNL